MIDPNQYDDPLSIAVDEMGKSIQSGTPDIPLVDEDSRVQHMVNGIDRVERAMDEGKPIHEIRDRLDAEENTARNQRIDRLLDTMTRHADTLVALSRHEPGARWRGRAIATAADAIRAEVGFEP